MIDQVKTEIKSINPVKLTHVHGWVVRIRLLPSGALEPGRELFLGVGAGYTLAQARGYVHTILRDVARHGVKQVLPLFCDMKFLNVKQVLPL